jgi:hypothetical protein
MFYWYEVLTIVSLWTWVLVRIFLRKIRQLDRSYTFTLDMMLNALAREHLHQDWVSLELNKGASSNSAEN